MIEIQNKELEKLHSLDGDTLIDILTKYLTEIEQLQEKGSYQIGLTHRDMIKIFLKSHKSGTLELQQEFLKNAILKEIVQRIEEVRWGLVSLLIRDTDIRKVLALFYKCRDLEDVKVLEQMAFQPGIDPLVEEYQGGDEVDDEGEEDYNTLNFTLEGLREFLNVKGVNAIDCEFGDDNEICINAIIEVLEPDLEDSEMKVSQYYLQQFCQEDFFRLRTFIASQQVRLSPTLIKTLETLTFL